MFTLRLSFFGWRNCRELLPVKKVLFQKNITVDATCPRCHSATETVLHGLKGCDRAKAVWCSVDCQQSRSGGDEQHILQWMLGILPGLSQGTFEKGLILFWAIWQWRNKEVMEGVQQSPNRVVQNAYDFYHMLF
ncbi:hypothetical protein PTKIN_Ptkin03bG0065000 [Pterospermum kingtungense]